MNLHSNMVRFIISGRNRRSINRSNIYIPIWLDLLLSIYYTSYLILLLFTFQYGQIYYFCFEYRLRISCDIYIPIWLDLLLPTYLLFLLVKNHLHSNMVRFIIYICISKCFFISIFTFQYGQIYYILKFCQFFFLSMIYIPIWLDLLSKSQNLTL